MKIGEEYWCIYAIASDKPYGVMVTLPWKGTVMSMDLDHDCITIQGERIDYHASVDDLHRDYQDALRHWEQVMREEAMAAMESALHNLKELPRWAARLEECHRHGDPEVIRSEEAKVILSMRDYL